MGDLDALYREGRRLEEQGQDEQAQEIFRQLSGRSPGDPRPWNRMGVIAARQKAFSEAAAFFRKALARDRSFAPALSNLGNLAQEQGDLEAAERFYTQAIEADPGFPDPHRNLAALARRRGDFARVAAEMKRYHRLQSRRSATSEAYTGSGPSFRRGCGVAVLIALGGLGGMLWLVHLA